MAVEGLRVFGRTRGRRGVRRRWKILMARARECFQREFGR